MLCSSKMWSQQKTSRKIYINRLENVIMESKLLDTKIAHIKEDLNAVESIMNKKKNIIHLKNVLKGVTISEDDLKDAKKSVWDVNL